MEEIWIIGVGHFGQRAFRRLSEGRQDRHFVLVDPVGKTLDKCNPRQARCEVSDGIAFIDKHLEPSGAPDWIIPALPLHLAAEWLLLHLGPARLKRTPLPSGLAKLVPNPFYGPEGNLYVSHADFRCPENCDEPRDTCTITGKTRKQNMYDLLASLHSAPFKPLNLRSHQMGPGIGGYRAEQLFELRDKVAQVTGPVLLSTACRCHGVISGLERI